MKTNVLIEKHQCDNCLELAEFEIEMKDVDFVLCSNCLEILKRKIREIGEGGYFKMEYFKEWLKQATNQELLNEYKQLAHDLYVRRYVDSVDKMEMLDTEILFRMSGEYLHVKLD